MTTAIEFMREHPNPTADDFIKAVALFGGPAVKEAAEQIKNEPRQAKCYMCKKMVPAVDGLCYSRNRGEGEYDLYYCGCRGWD